MVWTAKDMPQVRDLWLVYIFLGVYSRFRKHSCVPKLYGSEVPITFICGNNMISLFRRL